MWPEHRSVEAATEQRGPVAVGCQVLVGIDLEILDADQLERPVLGWQVEQDLGVVRVEAGAEQGGLDVVDAHGAGGALLARAARDVARGKGVVDIVVASDGRADVLQLLRQRPAPGHDNGDTHAEQRDDGDEDRERRRIG